MVYIIAFILPFIGVLFNNRMKPTPRKIFLAVICIYFILVIGLRYRVGVDTITYMWTFKSLKSIDKIFATGIFTYRYEPGYLLLTSLVRTFTDQFWVMQTVVATIVTSFIFIFLYRYCRNVFVGILFYLLLQWFYFSMEIMRESIALSIFLLNYRNLEEKKWGKYYFFSLFSIVFHYSAAIIWFIPLARYLKPNWVYFLLCACAIAATPIMQSVNEMLSFLTFSQRIDQYVAKADSLNLNWKLAELMRSGFPAIAVVMAYRIIRQKFAMRQMLLLQILFCMGAFAVPIVFSRFSNYTSMFVTVALANFVCSDRASQFLKCIIICFVIMTQSFYYYSMLPRWYPYVSIFNPKQIHQREQIWKHDFITWR